MKTKEDIEKRLKKLMARYAIKHIRSSQDRKHLNCVFNEVHQTVVLPYTRTKSIEMPVAPRDQSTVVVFQNENNGSVHLCMYGSEDSKNWKGSICDSDEVSLSCPMFKPRTSIQESKKEFIEHLADDEYVFNNYRDMATLQWVLGERVHEMSLSLFDRFNIWFKSLFIGVKNPVPDATVYLPDDIWDD